jgi:hypothetical protein
LFRRRGFFAKKNANDFLKKRFVVVGILKCFDVVGMAKTHDGETSLKNTRRRNISVCTHDDETFFLAAVANF